jgi:hypothetical protein
MRIAVGLAAVVIGSAGILTAQASGNGTAVVTGQLEELNSSGVAGTVTVLDKGDHLRVNLDVDGFEPMQAHLQHIHGFGDGTQATCPDMSLAGDDGVLSFAEGLPAYGPPVITLGHDHVDDGTLTYSRTFTETMAGAPVASLGSLDQYVVVVHGLTVGDAYVLSLPVACAVLTSHGE